MALEQLDVAIEGLSAAPAGKAVHEARKAIKRLRTLELLLRSREPRMKGKKGSSRRRSSRRWRKALRLAGRSLAGARDADVALSTLEGMIEREQTWRERPPAGLLRLKGILIAEREDAQRALRQDPRIGDAALRLQALREEMERERSSNGHSLGRRRSAACGQTSEACPRSATRQRRTHASGFDAIRPGLRGIYSEGRRQMRRAGRRSSVLEMHEWRKSAKQLRYAAEALTPAGEGKDAKRMRRLARQAERLGETLGEEHDLAMLAARVRRSKKLFKGEQKSRKALLKSIERRRERLRRRALKMGRRLYERKPKRFLKEIRRTLA